MDPSWRNICTDYEWDDTERHICEDDAIDESQKETIGNISFWLQGVFKFAIGIIGVISNLVAIPILCRQSMRSIFNKLLISLLVLHTIYLLAVIFTQMMWPDWENHPKDWFIVLFIFVLKPLQPLMLNSSTLITILLARQRYLAIRHPIEYRNSTIAVNPCIYAMKSLIFVLTASGLFALPIFFETSLGYTVVGAIEDVNKTHFQYVRIYCHCILNLHAHSHISILYQGIEKLFHLLSRFWRTNQTWKFIHCVTTIITCCGIEILQCWLSPWLFLWYFLHIGISIPFWSLYGVVG